MTLWRDVIGVEKTQPYFQETVEYVRREREQGKVIYPPAADVFNAFKFTEFDQVKVVIRAGSLSRAQPGTRPLFFRVARGAGTPFFGEHLQGAGAGSTGFSGA